MAAWLRERWLRTARKPSIWMVMSGVMATIATTPNARSSTLDSPWRVTQTPITIGRMKLDVSGLQRQMLICGGRLNQIKEGL